MHAWTAEVCVCTQGLQDSLVCALSQPAMRCSCASWTGRHSLKAHHIIQRPRHSPLTAVQEVQLAAVAS